jgi:hypothetical protein
MAYVLVDAAGCDELREALFAMGLKTTDPLMKQRFFEQSEKLAPVVPELPEGWMVDFEMDHQVAVRNADVWATIGAPGMEAYKSGTDPRVDFFPYEVAPYLLSRWQSLQGGA